jgi:hypothetical protein
LTSDIRGVDSRKIVTQFGEHLENEVERALSGFRQLLRVRTASAPAHPIFRCRRRETPNLTLARRIILAIELVQIIGQVNGELRVGKSGGQ